jgi:hypothetical protein
MRTFCCVNSLVQKKKHPPKTACIFNPNRHLANLVSEKKFTQTFLSDVTLAWPVGMKQAYKCLPCKKKLWAESRDLYTQFALVA